ncbi:DNA repair protein rhp42 [Venturia nashicola]|uniref:DNA repair protein rhp42 n=1 Tax=Venturia nashicola TaxID=86259 RepID=A0A4Z1PDU7_9PEZI|nr:DNA repair protein rhp42 [Venturia nashicola]
MPPFVARKRNPSASPAPSPSPPKKKQKTKKSSAKAKNPTRKPKKPRKNVFDALDAEPKAAIKRAEAEAFLDSLASPESSLSDVDSDEFEHVLPGPSTKRRKAEGGNDREESESDDDMDWETAMPAPQPSSPLHQPSGDLEISLGVPDDAVYSRTDSGGKKGPTKRERAIRVHTHCMHVQFLLWHNTIRNSWINDKDVQASLVDGLNESSKAEFSRWRNAMGYANGEAKDKPEASAGKPIKPISTVKGKGKAKEPPARIRDWGGDAAKQEEGAPNLSRGDPLIRLLERLSTYWKKRFKITAPGLRKLGYRSLKDIKEEVESYQNDPHDVTLHGERIANLDEFRIAAKKCEGSRDVSAQLFTALLRGLGIEARLVASLQPSGFGWSKNEEGKPRKPSNKSGRTTNPLSEGGSSYANASSKASASRGSGKVNIKRPQKTSYSTQVDLDNSSSELSSAPESDSDTPELGPSPAKASSFRSGSKDPPYPIYWTEALSPVTNTYFPVSTQIHPNVATKQEHYTAFEPRGAAADKAKQVLCYVVAHSKDGSAKDVTVRYLKRRQLPGKTKGFRLPVERVPIYNKRGKVSKYEKYDWFKRVMSGYERPTRKRIPADDIEDQGDLVPFKPAPSAKDGSGDKGVETLQGYKNSAEFVLERHLRREEALVVGAKPVKTFKVGKGDKATEEPVYRREDVVACKTVESWHKEGRELKIGEQALKYVPYRAVTTIRLRELEDTERETGEKPMQGLYSKAQTDWIIPDPIQDGHIPKNSFGNIDVYVPSMVPKGATHVRLKGTAKLCRKLGIDYAEACTGFEFGNRRAVPVLTGVVVTEENRQMVIDAWKEEDRIKREKEEGKREQRALALWKKFLHGLKVVKRMKEIYGMGDDLPDDANPFMRKQNHPHEGRAGASPVNGDEDLDGGFLLGDNDAPDDVGGGGFLRPGESEDESESEVEPGGFILEGEDEELPITKIERKNKSSMNPISLLSLHREATPVAEGPEMEQTSAITPKATSDEDSDEAPVKPKRASQRTRATSTRGRKARGGSSTRLKRTAIIDEDEDDDEEKAESTEADSPLSSPAEDSEDDSEAFAPTKPKRGNSRTRGVRGRKTRGGSTRQLRGAAMSSPYFKKTR